MSRNRGIVCLVLTFVLGVLAATAANRPAPPPDWIEERDGVWKLTWGGQRYYSTRPGVGDRWIDSDGDPVPYVTVVGTDGRGLVNKFEAMQAGERAAAAFPEDVGR